MKPQILIALVLGLTVPAVAQTACTQLNPCVELSIANANTTPSTVVFWSCLGTTGCTQADLNTVLASQTTSTLCPAVQSVWHCTTFSQTKEPQLYNDPEQWGSLVNYSVQGVSAGGVSANSPILIFQVPQASAQVPALSSPIVVTTGNVGPQ